MRSLDRQRDLLFSASASFFFDVYACLNIAKARGRSDPILTRSDPILTRSVIKLESDLKFYSNILNGRAYYYIYKIKIFPESN
jgi:hypothetical protein